MTWKVDETLQDQKAFAQVNFKKLEGPKGLQLITVVNELALKQCTPFSQHMNDNFTHIATDGTTITNTCENELGSLANECDPNGILSGESECSDPRLLDFKTTYYDSSKYYNPIPTIIKSK
jgi:hypothetical protein